RSYMYTSYQQQQAVFPGGSVIAHLSQTLVLRMAPGSDNREGDIASAVKRAVAGIDPDRPITDVMSIEALMRTTTDVEIFYMRLLESFAALALLLAVVGIYGVMSYFVSERTHEIGIRVALGARAVDVLGMVGKLGIKLTLWGVAIGAALALGLTQLISSFL